MGNGSPGRAAAVALEASRRLVGPRGRLALDLEAAPGLAIRGRRAHGRLARREPSAGSGSARPARPSSHGEHGGARGGVHSTDVHERIGVSIRVPSGRTTVTFQTSFAPCGSAPRTDAGTSELRLADAGDPRENVESLVREDDVERGLAGRARPAQQRCAARQESRPEARSEREARAAGRAERRFGGAGGATEPERKAAGDENARRRREENRAPPPGAGPDDGSTGPRQGVADRAGHPDLFRATRASRDVPDEVLAFLRGHASLKEAAKGVDRRMFAASGRCPARIDGAQLFRRQLHNRFLPARAARAGP